MSEHKKLLKIPVASRNLGTDGGAASEEDSLESEADGVDLDRSDLKLGDGKSKHNQL